MRYLARSIEQTLRELSGRHPVVVLTGARQTGKTTLLGRLFRPPAWRTVSLDDLDHLELAHVAPDDLVAGATKLAVDEVQKAPGLLNSIKRIVDRNRSSVRFVLSGSANLLLMRQVSESLAGRAVHADLCPLTVGELQQSRQKGLLGNLFDEGFVRGFTAWASGGRTIPTTRRRGGAERYERMISSSRRLSRKRLLEMVWTGGFPALIGLGKQGIAEWFQGYERTYLERDVVHLAQLAEVIPFRRTIRVAALQSGGVVNLASMSRDLGLSAPTVRHYLELLEVSMLGHLLPPFVVHRRKRVIKSPKFYLRDSGLAAHLCGLPSTEQLASSPVFPAILETWVLQQLESAAALLRPAASVCYWRTTDNWEVDFLVEWNGRLVAAEVKSAAGPGVAAARGLVALRKEYPDLFSAGLLLHTGSEIQSLGDRLIALPAACLALL